jgi:hypothetical protein
MFDPNGLTADLVRADRFVRAEGGHPDGRRRRTTQRGQMMLARE